MSTNFTTSAGPVAQAGFEPAAKGLSVPCSTSELHRRFRRRFGGPTWIRTRDLPVMSRLL